MEKGFLEALSAEEMAALRAVGAQRSYEADVTLLHRGDEAGPVVVLLRGRVKITAATEGGDEAIIAVRGPGDLIGGLAAIDDQPRAWTVTTLEHDVVGRLSQRLVELCERFGVARERASRSISRSRSRSSPAGLVPPAKR